MIKSKDSFLKDFTYRFSIAVNTTTKTSLLQHLKITRPTLRRYTNTEYYPDIITLAQTAKATCFNMHWLLFGDEPVPNKSHTIIIKDDVLTPLLKKGDIVVTGNISIPSNQHRPPDGLYCVKEQDTESIHRLSWDISHHQFSVCDNHQHVKTRFIDQNQIYNTPLFKMIRLKANPTVTNTQTMSPLTLSLDQYLQEQGLEGYQHRLSHIISQQPLFKLARETNINVNTLKKYITQTSTPDLSRLINLAEILSIPLHTLLFSKIAPWHYQPRITTARTLVLDEHFAPFIPKGAEVEYFINNDITYVEKKEIYVIDLPNGRVLRRIQWEEKNQQYLIFSDNPAYPQQRVKQVNIIGTVTAILTSI